MKFDQKTLQLMFNEQIQSKAIYQPSKHWQRLNKIHIKQLTEGNINNFKRSVNMKYFNWGTLGIVVHQMGPIIQNLLRGHLSIFLRSSFKRYNSKLGQKVTEFDFLSAQLYKLFVAALFNVVREKDQLDLLTRFQEPSAGNPFVIKYKDQIITQDLCNSVLEFYSINEDSGRVIKPKSKLDVAEIGAGYGRLSYIYLKAFPKSTYCIIDIPTALYISQEYLTKVFPDEKIFRFRHFGSFREIKKEFLESRIRFVMAYQLEMLPDGIFDQIINISSLHEMTREQIKNYLHQMDRLGKGYVYTKQWRKSRVSDNQNIGEHEYPIPKRWVEVYHRRHPIQGMFFEALYKIR